MDVSSFLAAGWKPGSGNTQRGVGTYGGKKVPAEAIKNFDEEAAVNVIGNTYNSHDTSTLNAFNYYCSFNPIDKIIELYDALVKSEKEKVELLQKIMEGKK